MKYDPQIHPGARPVWDYSWPWWYYMTFVVKNRETILGKVVKDVVHLSPFGEVVGERWLSIPQRYTQTELDDYVALLETRMKTRQKNLTAEAQRTRRKYLEIENTLRVSFSVISASLRLKRFICASK